MWASTYLFFVRSAGGGGKGEDISDADKLTSFFIVCGTETGKDQSKEKNQAS